MEKYQILQSIFGCLGLLSTLLVAIFGYLWNYYGGLIDDLRNEQQKVQTEISKKSIIEKIDSSSEKLAKEIHAVSRKPIVKKTETIINAPNAQNVVVGDKNIVGNTVNIGDQRIILDDEMKQFLVGKLNEELGKNQLNKSSSIRITAVQDNKAVDVAQQLYAHLKSQGYTIKDIGSIAASYPIHKKIRIYYDKVEKAVTIDVGFFVD